MRKLTVAITLLACLLSSTSAFAYATNSDIRRLRVQLQAEITSLKEITAIQQKTIDILIRRIEALEETTKSGSRSADEKPASR